MVNSWRAIAALLSVFVAENSAFVSRAPLTVGNNHHSAIDGRSRPATSRVHATPARVVARTPWTCLAPGGKVGRSKVSLDRAVTTIAQPKSETAKEQETKKVTKTKRATETEDAPMFKVILIGDEEYNREHVVLSIQDIVPDTDNTRAADIFEEAQDTGKGFCGTYPEEEAELYVEQFTRCEPIIYADMEKEGAEKGARAGAVS